MDKIFPNEAFTVGQDKQYHIWVQANECHKAPWNFRIKYVDDISVIEVIPFVSARGMRLNPKKCKEMLLNTLQYRLPIQTPLFIGEYAIEPVKSFKLLGANFSGDLTWPIHCECIIKKASKRLYIIRQLRKAGYCTKELVAIYCSLVRPQVTQATQAMVLDYDKSGKITFLSLLIA